MLLEVTFSLVVHVWIHISPSKLYTSALATVFMALTLPILLSRVMFWPMTTHPILRKAFLLVKMEILQGDRTVQIRSELAHPRALFFVTLVCMLRRNYSNLLLSCIRKLGLCNVHTFVFEANASPTGLLELYS